MKHLYVLAFCLSAPALAGEYGTKVGSKDNCTLSEAVANFERYKDTDITTSVQVDKVCEKKGCWMQVSDGKQSVRVTFKDYGFFVPTDLDGKKVRITGRLERKQVSVDEQKHYLEDAGASKQEIDKITAPNWEYRFIATGVTSAGLEKKQ